MMGLQTSSKNRSAVTRIIHDESKPTMTERLKLKPKCDTCALLVRPYRYKCQAVGQLMNITSLGFNTE